MTQAPAAANPFPGLRPFREDEEHLFFGRESQVDAMIDKLAATHFLAVLGTSGSGKSSLVNCGLRPALHRGSMASAGAAWRVAQFRPGGDPIGALSRALARDGVLFGGSGGAGSAGSPAASAAPATRQVVIETNLRMSKLGLVDIVEQARLPPGVNLLIVVDQFEELFRYGQLDAAASVPAASRTEEAAAFVNLLLQVRARTDGAIHVVLTMRSDFLGDCTRLPGLVEAINAGQYLVPRMTRDERREAITGPLGVGSAQISPVLLNRLVNDVGDNPDQLSILQHALNRTWAAWQAETGGEGPIGPRHYDAIGTMAQALDRHAEGAFAELQSDREQGVCERVFKALTDQATDPRGVRRPTRLDVLCALAMATRAEVDTVIEVFRDPERSFLMPPFPEALHDDTVIDISHESLMRVWQRLQAWATEEALSAQQLRRVADAAALHAAGNSSLWRDPELQRAMAWRERQQPTDAWSARYGVAIVGTLRFIDASAAAREAERAAERRRLARRRAAVVATFVVLVGVGAVFFGLWQSAQSALREAVAGKTVMQSRAMLAPDEPSSLESALLIGAAGYRLRESNETYAGLQALAEATARLRRVVSFPEPVLAYSPDQRSAVTVHDRTLRLWNTDTGEPRGAPMRAHTGTVNSAAFSPDGTLLATVAEDATLRLWDARSGAPRGGPFNGHDGQVWSVAFSADGTTVATGGEDGTVRLWDVASGKARGAPLQGHTNRVWALAFNPDGSLLASGSDDMTARLWNVQSGQAHGAPLQGHSGVVSCVAFSPDGSTLATGSADNSLRLWNARSGEAHGVPMLGHTSRIWSVAFSPDGAMLASGGEDRMLRLWDVGSGQPRGAALQGHKDRIWRVAFSADGRSIVSASNDRTIARWEAVAPAEASETDHAGPIRSVAVSPDGKTFVTGGDDMTLRLWDAATRRPRGAALVGHTAAVASVAFSPDGATIASAGEDGNLRLWAAAAGRPLGKAIRADVDRVWSVAFSPDGRTLVSGGADGSVRLWDAATGLARGAPLRGHSQRVWSVAFSPDGKAIASASEDASVRLWDAATGQPRGAPLLGHIQRVWSVAFSPDGRRLASGGEDTTVRLWDAATRQPIGEPLTGHSQAVTSVAFSPDGKTLASGSDDATLRVWDATSGKSRGAPMHGHEAAVAGIAFSPDSKTLVFALDDGTLGTWDAPAGRIDRVCAKVVRNLSRLQWQQLVGDIGYVVQCPGLPIAPD